MRIIEYQKSYSSKWFERLNKRALVILLISISLLAFLFLLLYYSLLKPPRFLEPYKKFFPYLSIIIILILTNLKNDIEDALYEQKIYYKGEKGEEIITEVLKRSLDHRFIYIKNYSLPNVERGDIDGLILGPKGIIVLEVKNYFGEFRISGSDLYRKTRKWLTYKLYPKSPIRQVLKQAYFLRQILKDKNIDVKIIPIVVFVNGRIESIQDLDECFVVEYSDLTDFIYSQPDLKNWNEDLEKNVLNILGVAHLI